MTRTLALVALVAMALASSGCAQITGFTEADAASAAALAAATGDTANAACYADIGKIAVALDGAAQGQAGLLTKIEAKRAVQGVLADPSCASLWLGLVGTALKGTPLGPFVP